MSDLIEIIENALVEIPDDGDTLDAALNVVAVLKRHGYFIVHPDAIGWPELHIFNDERAKGQSPLEDAGGYVSRMVFGLFGRRAGPVENYQQAAKRLLEEAERKREAQHKEKP